MCSLSAFSKRARLETNLAAICLAMVALGCCRADAAQIQYTFEDGTFTAGWSPLSIGNSPLGGKALGPLGNQAATLVVMDALPDSSSPPLGERDPRTVQVSFDLILTGPWAGDTAGSPSIFRLVGNGATLLETTFSTGAATQSYPSALGGGSWPAGTGASPFVPGGTSNYRLQAAFPLFSRFPNPTDIFVDFSASGLPPAAAWRLDNVTVDWSQPVPEPPSAILASFAIILFVRSIRNRHRVSNSCLRSTRGFSFS